MAFIIYNIITRKRGEEEGRVAEEETELCRWMIGFRGKSG